MQILTTTMLITTSATTSQPLQGGSSMGGTGAAEGDAGYNSGPVTGDGCGIGFSGTDTAFESTPLNLHEK